MSDRSVGSTNVAGQYWNIGAAAARALCSWDSLELESTSSAIGLFRGIVNGFLMSLLPVL